MIQDSIFSILSGIIGLTNLVNDNIKPIGGTVNQGAPLCLYQLEAGEIPQTLDGPSDLCPYTLTVYVTSPDLSQVSTALAAVKSTLNGYADETVVYLAYTGESEASDQDEVTYRVQTYSGWARG